MDHDDAKRMIEAIAAAFDRHDLDAIMSYFADDAVFEAPRGPDPWGRRAVGHDEVRSRLRRSLRRDPRRPLPGR